MRAANKRFEFALRTPDSKKRGVCARDATAELRRQMKTIFGIIVLGATVGAVTSASGAQLLCAPLREFVRSVRPGEVRELTFHTSWGSDFKDSSEEAIYAKRCVHNGYAPAEKVCDYLMEYGAVEFAGNNVKDALTCLSSNTRFAPLFGLHRGSFSLSFGTENRGANIEMDFYED
ncbi:MAG TPA: hypothetical protein VGN07_10880, partial [Steroidobacteraceae bacterium]